MPHEVVHSPLLDRSRSLGWLAIAWMEYFVRHGPGDVQGQPIEHGDEYTRFVVDCYGVDENLRLLHDSAFFSRPKGADKSGLGARLALFEGLGPCRPAGFAKGGEVYTDPWGLGFSYAYEPGEPMGRPVEVPYIRILATEEGQTGNVYDSIYVNLTDDEFPLSHVPGVDAGVTWVNLPGGGVIMPSTASSSSKDGGKETFSVFDETHLYKTPELRRMYATVTRNMRKRKKLAQTWYLETTTMFAAGEESVAEATYKLAGLIREGKARRSRLLFDHRFALVDDLSDEKDLRRGIVEAFGEAMGWNHLDGIVDQFYDPRAATVDSRRFFLNAVGTTVDAYLAEYEWAGCAAPDKVVADGETITLGFDGSRKRSEGVTDATALIACRLEDGHIFEPLARSVWEQPEGQTGTWEVPVYEVEAAVALIFDRYRVVGFFADPAKWEGQVAAWEAKWHKKLKVKATQQHPVQWWFGGTRTLVTSRAVDQFRTAVLDQELTHDGSYVLTRHVLNARRIMTTGGYSIGKENPDSPRKMDATVAAVLAWQARLAAIAAGVTPRKSAGKASFL